MPARGDFLSKQRRQIDKRLQELRPAHEEYLALLQAKQALDGLNPPSRGPGTRALRAPARPSRQPRRRRATTAPAASRNGTRRPRRTTRRRRAGETRADQTLSLIKSNPGISVPQIADRMGIGRNYLYRVTAALQKQGSVKRQGQGFMAT